MREDGSMIITLHKGEHSTPLLFLALIAVVLYHRTGSSALGGLQRARQPSSTFKMLQVSAHSLHAGGIAGGIGAIQCKGEHPNVLSCAFPLMA